jgi:hypothetical protein
LFDLNIFCSGSMEFVVPQTDSSAFFPISVRFTATDTFSDLKVCLKFFLSVFTCVHAFIFQCTMMVIVDLIFLTSLCRLLTSFH